MCFRQNLHISDINLSFFFQQGVYTFLHSLQMSIKGDLFLSGLIVYFMTESRYLPVLSQNVISIIVYLLIIVFDSGFSTWVRLPLRDLSVILLYFLTVHDETKLFLIKLITLIFYINYTNLL